MSEPNFLTVQFGTVPTQLLKYPEDTQKLGILIAQYITVRDIGPAKYFNFGFTTPSAEYTAYPWLRTGPTGKPIGWFIYEDGAWVQVPAVVERGETDQRPANPVDGQLFDDKTINTVIVWRDENGIWVTLDGSKYDIKMVPGGSSGIEETKLEEKFPGWYICNGQSANGVTTPDFRNRFPVSYGTDYEAGTTGGSLTNEVKVEKRKTGGNISTESDDALIFRVDVNNRRMMNLNLNVVDGEDEGQLKVNPPPFLVVYFLMKCY